MQSWFYNYAGLKVSSELELPEWQVFESAQVFDNPDIVIRMESSEFAGMVPISTRDLCSFHVEDVGDYSVRSGYEIAISPMPGVGEREVRLFLLGTAWGALCYQRGILVLHASVVQVDDHAIAFCGESGAGKSSVVAWLAARGYRAVGDDLCHFDPDTEPPLVYPAAPRLKLWSEALTNLGLPQDNLERDYYRMDKFHLSFPSQGMPGEKRQPPEVDMSAPLPLRSIYLLKWGEPRIHHLTGMAALRRFIEAATYRGMLLDSMGLSASYWEQCAKLAQRVPIYTFARPPDWSIMDASMEMLVEHWQDVLDTK